VLRCFQQTQEQNAETLFLQEFIFLNKKVERDLPKHRIVPLTAIICLKANA